MKGVAFVGLIFGIIGLVLMIYGAFSESAYRGMDCEDDGYLRVNYGNYEWESQVLCNEDKVALYETVQLSSSIGSANLFFSLVLMVGANRLQD
jgi:hypothetical protein